MSPWSLFQQLCQSGGLAIGPQCQNSAQQQLGASTSPLSSSLPSSTCQNGFTSYALKVQPPPVQQLHCLVLALRDLRHKVAYVCLQHLHIHLHLAQQALVLPTI